jgi:WD40 repeat protein
MLLFPTSVRNVLLLLSCAYRLGRAAVCNADFSWYADLESSAGVVRSVAYIPDADLAVAGGEDQILRVWTLSPFSSTPSLFYGHQEAIWALEWIAEYSVLAAGAGDGFIRFWPIDVLQGSPSAQSCLPFRSNDGTCLGSEGQHVVSWHDAEMSTRHQVHSLVWASSIGKLFSGWSDTRIRTWAYLSGTPSPGNPWYYTGYAQSEDRVYDMVWLPGHGLLATASPDQRHPRLWDGFTATSGSDSSDGAFYVPGLRPPFSGPLGPTTSNYSYTYLTQELPYGHGDCPWAHCDAVLALIADAADSMVASGSMDNSVILWDVIAKNRQCQFTGHTDYVTSLVWLDSEAKIASGSKDNSIRIWSTEDCNSTETYNSVQTLTSHTGAVNALAWRNNSDGALISGGADGYVKLWRC